MARVSFRVPEGGERHTEKTLEMQIPREYSAEHCSGHTYEETTQTWERIARKD